MFVRTVLIVLAVIAVVGVGIAQQVWILRMRRRAEANMTPRQLRNHRILRICLLPVILALSYLQFRTQQH